MKKLLFSWIGRTDLRAPEEEGVVGCGPIAQALSSLEFNEVILLSDYPPQEVEPYIAWLRFRTSTTLTVQFVQLSSPVHFGEIYQATTTALQEYRDVTADKVSLTFHLSPGTPAMAAIWILLAKTFIPAQLIESSREKGVNVVDVPFDISAEYIPSLLRLTDKRLATLSLAATPESSAFSDIIYRSSAMQRIVERAQRVALHSVPVLIEGESGTGKELFAKAIHNASLRAGQKFVSVNCGAIPSEMVEGELFGYCKGAFTGAITDHKGYFEAADNGTLFLDEIGELPLAAQVKLLRVLQEGQVTRLGETQPRNISMRIIAATNKSLIEEVSHGRFRADLFYRLAVAVLNLPPLRDRQGDIGLLADYLIKKQNPAEIKNDTKHKKISVNAKKYLIKCPWPGNVRELENTLARSAVWSLGNEITLEDVQEATLPSFRPKADSYVPASLDEPINLQELCGNLVKNYLKLALKKSGGNKTKAAQLLGVPNYQTLSNWIKKYGIE